MRMPSVVHPTMGTVNAAQPDADPSPKRLDHVLSLDSASVLPRLERAAWNGDSARARRSRRRQGNSLRRGPKCIQPVNGKPLAPIRWTRSVTLASVAGDLRRGLPQGDEVAAALGTGKSI